MSVYGFVDTYWGGAHSEKVGAVGKENVTISKPARGCWRLTSLVPLYLSAMGKRKGKLAPSASLLLNKLLNSA